MIIRHKITVQGVVQMVCFRDFTMRTGKYLGLSGSCENIENDKVEIFVEGEEEMVNLFTKCVYFGPRYARVDGITIDKVEVTGETGFKRIEPPMPVYTLALSEDLVHPYDCIFCEKVVTDEQLGNGDALVLASQWPVHLACYKEATKV